MNRPKDLPSDLVGKSFVFDYDEFAVEVKYLSKDRFSWTQVRGPSAGSKGKQSFGGVTIRPNLYFLWWREKDQSVLTQVVDLAGKCVHTTWSAPGKDIANFKGRISALTAARARGAGEGA